MYYCGGPITVSNNTAGSGSLPVGSNATGHINSMQAPNNSGIGSSRPGGASITNDLSKLQQRITKVQEKIHYFGEQLEGANKDLVDIVSKRLVYVDSGKAEE